MSYSQRPASDPQAVKDPLRVFNALGCPNLYDFVFESFLRKLILHIGTILFLNPPLPRNVWSPCALVAMLGTSGDSGWNGLKHYVNHVASATRH